MNKNEERHCYNCKYLREHYAMKRNDEGRFDRVLDDVTCEHPDKDDMVQGPCDYFEPADTKESE